MTPEQKQALKEGRDKYWKEQRKMKKMVKSNPDNLTKAKELIQAELDVVKKQEMRLKKLLKVFQD